MRVAVFSTQPYDREFLETANVGFGHELGFFEGRLTTETVSLAFAVPAVCVFVHDVLDAPVISMLHAGDTKLIALRCAGFNNVDLLAAERQRITVSHVPAYSPYAVAEHAIGLILALDRKVHRAYARVREGNFELQGLLGFDLHGKTVGVVGTGRIGTVAARILAGFGCRVLAHDPHHNDEVKALGATYVPLETLLAESDVVTLHCPLTPETHHLIDATTLAQCKPGVMLINTSRGALVDTQAVVDGLKTGRVGALGLDVYEEEADLFYRDLSGEVIQDDVFSRLQTFPNVLITGHQAYFTREAMQAIAHTTLASIAAFERGELSGNEVTMAANFTV